MEENISLEKLQQDLINDLYRGEDGEEWNLSQFEAVSKALAEQRKAENERLRIEAESARAAKDAEVAELRSERELKGNVLRTVGQIGGSAIAGAFGLIMGSWILDAENRDVLCNSKAWSWIMKLRG